MMLKSWAFLIAKYFMRINEVINPLLKFIATVSVKGTQARTMIDAKSEGQARLLLGKQFGEKNIVTVSRINLDEQVSVATIPTDLKHERVVNYLTKKITQFANKPRFTRDDVKKAIERYRTNQKKANLELDKRQKLQQMRSR